MTSTLIWAITAILGTSFLVCAVLVLTQRWHGRLSLDSDLGGIQKRHATPVPRVGGLGLIISLLIGIAVGHQLQGQTYQTAVLLLLAALGVESAQYNAAYILSKCTHCLPIDKSTSQLGEKPSASAKLEAAFSSDPLERQHRKNKHSTATNFRTVYKDHVKREKARKQANRAAEAARRAQDTREEPAVVASTAITPANAAFLPVSAWSTFLIQYNPLHMQDELDIEFEARK